MLILRDCADHDEVEILFVRRAQELKFMGGAWVFPGGGLAKEDGDPADELTYRRAAVRETAEEAGLALAGPESLIPFSRWITPELAPIRFDTHFYLAIAPDGAEARPDRREVDKAEWWTPSKTLDHFVNDTAELHFPTIKQVEELTDFSCSADALAACSQRTITPILPRVAASDDGFEILLPGDPGYEQAS